VLLTDCRRLPRPLPPPGSMRPSMMMSLAWRGGPGLARCDGSLEEAVGVLWVGGTRKPVGGSSSSSNTSG
jgi:hypothetical protein